jgi:hypothetical protein
MAGNADEDALRGTHSILSWYDSTRPMFIDLVGDYAGKELFLVEGDSLLRECFEDERIDFEGTRKPSRVRRLSRIRPLNFRMRDIGAQIIFATGFPWCLIIFGLSYELGTE